MPTVSDPQPCPSPLRPPPPPQGGEGLEVEGRVPDQHLHHQPHCPRCGSQDTKFCYYNNYNLSQPRYFCKSCRRYWTLGGSLRNIPVGGTTRAARGQADRHCLGSSSSSAQKPRSKRRKRQSKLDAPTTTGSPPYIPSATASTPSASAAEEHPSSSSAGKKERPLPTPLPDADHHHTNETTTAPASGGDQHQPPAASNGDDAFGFGALLAEPLPLFLQSDTSGYVADGLGLGLGLTGGYLDYDMMGFSLDRPTAYTWPSSMLLHGPMTTGLQGSDVAADTTTTPPKITSSNAAGEDACYFSMPGLGVSSAGSNKA